MLKKISSLILSFIIILSFNACGKDGKKDDQKKNDQKTVTKKGKVFKLAIMEAQNKEPYKSTRLKAIEVLKTKYGFEVGKNLEISYVSIGNDKNKGIKALDEIAAKKPDVILIGGTVAGVAVKESKYFKDNKYNFIFSNITDPVGVGLVDSMDALPPHNVTGVCYPVPAKSRLKFVKTLMPKLKTIALIYADMPQSHSYKKWVDLAIRTPELKNLKVIYKVVPLIKGEDGAKKMAAKAKKFVKQLNNKVDAFIGPNDQMGVQKPFNDVVYKNSNKPLIGLSVGSVTKGWGATASIAPDTVASGEQIAEMISDVFQGKKIQDIMPQWPRKYAFAFDLKKAKKFKINVPVDLIEATPEKNVIK